MTDQSSQAPDADDDEPLSVLVHEAGELVSEVTWEMGGPGASGGVRIYEYQGKFYGFWDDQFAGPFETVDAAKDHFDGAFHPVNEDDESDDAVLEIWSKEYGVCYQRPSLAPLTENDDRFSSRWVIDGTIVTEPWVGGKKLGELPGYDTKGARLVHFTQAEFDELQEEFRKEHGHYPAA